MTITVGASLAQLLEDDQEEMLDETLNEQQAEAGIVSAG